MFQVFFDFLSSRRNKRMYIKSEQELRKIGYLEKESREIQNEGHPVYVHLYDGVRPSTT